MAKKAKTRTTTKKSSPTRMELKAAAIAACRDAVGRITPKAVWQAAKDPDNILHSEFDWDVNRAAEKHWERTAAELIRQVKVPFKYETRNVAVPVYVSDPRTKESSYYPIMRVAKNPPLALRVVRDEVDRIIASIHRGRSVAAALDLTSSFDRLLAEAINLETQLDELEAGNEARA